MQFLANFIPHILFIISQTFCGAFLMLLLGPLIVYIWSGQYDFSSFILSFPDFWTKLLMNNLSFYKLLVLQAVFFSLGMLYAEFCYRLGRKIGYQDDLNLEGDQSRDASIEEQIDLFEWKCRILRYPNLHRIWEWENFQSSFFLYVEYVMLIFCPMYLLCFSITAFHSALDKSEVYVIILALFFGLLAIVFFFVMRRARIEKYQSFALAQKAIENIFKEEKTLEEKKQTENRGVAKHKGEV